MTLPAQKYELLSPQEVVELGAADSIFYSHYFFPETFRQASPIFHREAWNLLDSPEHPYIGMEMFRGSAKTTLTRTNVSKRVAYGISRTILFASSAQNHAVRSVRWVKKQIAVNRRWTEIFGLRKGSKWADDEIEIVNEILGISIHLLAVGITGQIRGVNLEDYRPDFIIVDDPCDEENTGTEEQRKKTAALFFGALAPGLAPRSESPHAKMALLQTGLHKEDLIHTAHNDPQWKTVKYGILSYDQDGNPRSTWPERWSTEEVLAMKEAYTKRGQLHLWLREYECEITSPEEAPLKLEWLKYYDYLPEQMVVYFGIDPAREKSNKPHKTCIVAIGVSGNDVYLLDYFMQTGLNPDEAWNAFYGMAMRWRPFQSGVETIAYQQTLAWYFRKKMQECGTFFNLVELEDRRKKSVRILDALTGLAAEGHLYVRAEQSEWIDYYRDWRFGDDIDLLDATAQAICLAKNQLVFDLALETAAYVTDESNIPDLDLEGVLACP